MPIRNAVRRLLWLLPGLFALSLVTFPLVSRFAGGLHGAAPDRALPIFFNTEPDSIQRVADGALATVALGGDQAAEAASTLVWLGGAALPHVLPELDSLAPEARRRVARALLPIARRMGIPGVDEVERQDTAVVFWTRFWQDRSVDFRPTVVKRLVARLAERELSLRRDDLIELDTYALATLMNALRTARNPAARARATRISEVLAHVTGQPWVIREQDSLEQANRLVVTWHRWWAEHRHEYASLEGPARLAAMVTQTRYGEWITQALKHRAGLLRDGTSIVDVLARHGPTTGSLLFAGWIGALGGAWCGLRLGLSRRRAAHPIALLAAAALPIAALLPALRFAPLHPWAGAALLVATSMALKSACIQTREVRAWLRTEAEDAPAGASRAGAPSAFRETGSVWTSTLGASLPALLVLSLVAELALGVDALGRTTLAALKQGDVAWLMALSLLGAAVAAMLQWSSDAALRAISAPIRAALERRAAA